MEKRKTDLRNEKGGSRDSRMRQTQTESNKGYDNPRKRLNAEGQGVEANRRQEETLMGNRGNDERLRPTAAPEKAGERRNSFTKEQTLQHGANTYERLEEIMVQRRGKGTNRDGDKRRDDPMKEK